MILTTLLLAPLALPMAPPFQQGRNPRTRSQQPVQTDRDLLLRSARNAVALGDKELAVSRFEELLTRFPQDREGLWEYSGLLLQAGRAKDAVEKLLVLVKLDETNLDYRSLLSDIFIQLGQYDRAIPELRWILDQDPTDVQVAMKLARVYAWKKDYDAATATYRRYLRGLDPNDVETQRLIAPLLLDTQRPDEALPILEGLVRREPDSLELASLLARCYTQLGEYKLVSQAVKSMRILTSAEIPVLQDLADYLASVGNYGAAAIAYEQILTIDPENRDARLGTAHLYMKAYMPSQALAVLRSYQEFSSDDLFQLALAEYHVLVGEYSDAKQIYRTVMRDNPRDDALHVKMGAVYHQGGEFELAKSEYLKVPAHDDAYRAARLGLSQTLAAQGRFDESNVVCRELISDNETDHFPLLQLVENLGRQDDVQQATWICEEFLTSRQPDIYTSVQVRLALARVMLDAGQALDAVYQYEEVMRVPFGRQPASVHGLSYAYSRLQNREKSDQVLLSASVSRLGDDLRSRIILGDLAAADGEYAQAIEMYEHVLRYDPENLPAMVRLGEAQTSGWELGLRFEAKETFKKILARSPSNIRAHLGMARAYASEKLVADAVGEYDLVLSYDKDNTVAILEKARVLYWSSRYEESDRAYARLNMPTAMKNMGINPFAQSGAMERNLSDEDYGALAAIERGAQMEQRAKLARRELLDYDSIPLYRSLVEMQPFNQEAHFDLAQAYSETEQTQSALDQYEELLVANPHHREASMALAHGQASLAPQLRVEFEHRDTQGGTANFNPSDPSSPAVRNVLENITANTMTLQGIWHTGDEDEYLTAGYRRLSYSGPSGTATDVGGNALVGGFSIKPFEVGGTWEKFRFFGEAGWEDYSSATGLGLQSKAVFDGGIELDVTDRLTMYGRAFKESVAVNVESLNQDISRTGVQIGGGYRADRRFDYGGSIMMATYNDDNSMNGLHGYSAWTLALPPTEFKVVLNFDYQDYANSSDFTTVTNWATLESATHPYYAPSGYSIYSASFEWRHYLSHDYFKGADRFWYEASYTGMVDSSAEYYNQIQAALNYEMTSNLSARFEIGMLTSGVFDTSSAAGYLVVSF